MAENMLSSPTSRKQQGPAPVVPSDSSKRQRPIHPELSQIKVPTSDLKTYKYHPATCEPFTREDFHHHKFRELQKQYGSPEAARKAQQELIQKVKERMEDSEHKGRDIDRKLEEMEKSREIERKVFQKSKGKKDR